MEDDLRPVSCSVFEYAETWGSFKHEKYLFLRKLVFWLGLACRVERRGSIRARGVPRVSTDLLFEVEVV